MQDYSKNEEDEKQETNDVQDAAQPMDEENQQEVANQPIEEENKQEVTNQPQGKTNKMLMAEVLEYHKLRQEYKTGGDKEKLKYVLNKDWLSTWKKACDYFSIRWHNFDEDYEISDPDGLVDTEIPPIDNSSLLLNDEEYLYPDDKPECIILPIQFNSCKAVSKDIWEFFKGKYGGSPEITVRVKKNQTAYGGYYYQQQYTFDVNYLRICFTILPPKEGFNDLDNINEMKYFVSYISTEKKISDIKELILKLIKKYHLLKEEINQEEPRENTHEEEKKENEDVEMKDETHNENESAQQRDQTKKPEPKKKEEPPKTRAELLRFWTADQFLELESIVSALTEHREDIFDSPEPMDTDSEISLFQLEQFGDTQIKEIFGKDENSKDNNGFQQMTVLIEQPKYIFKGKNEKVTFGNCEFCRKTTLLKVACKCKEVFYCSESCLERDRRFHEDKCRAAITLENPVRTDRSKNGLVGLTNLGNTCFMNSSLQCLSNCYELTRYFLEDEYLKDINESNPIGSKGKIANAYANLLKNLWYGDSNVFSPTYFKRTLGDFQRMFSGYHQHDTQEFLNYLLDGLHEDLNRVLKKPFVEKNESDMPDEQKSKICWIDFLRRNQSVLVDLFYGQFKSTLTCPNPNCKNISITFDPFLSVSLPLVEKAKPVSVKVFFIFYDISVSPVGLRFNFYDGEQNFYELRKKISTTLNVHPFSFLIVLHDTNWHIEKVKVASEPLKAKEKYSYYYNREEKKYFAFQINPSIYYSNLIDVNEKLANEQYKKIFTNENVNEYALKIAEIYKQMNEAPNRKNDDEEENAKTADSSYNAIYDNNLGMKEDIVRTYLAIENESNTNLSYQRAIYLPGDLKGKKLYFEIFKYFYKFIFTGLKELIEKKVEKAKIIFFNKTNTNSNEEKMHDDLSSSSSDDPNFRNENEIKKNEEIGAKLDIPSKEKDSPEPPNPFENEEDKKEEEDKNNPFEDKKEEEDKNNPFENKKKEEDKKNNQFENKNNDEAPDQPKEPEEDPKIKEEEFDKLMSGNIKIIELIKKYEENLDNVPNEALVDIFEYFCKEVESLSVEDDAQAEGKVIPFVLQILDYNKRTYYWTSSNEKKIIGLDSTTTLKEMSDAELEDKKKHTYTFDEEDKISFGLTIFVKFNNIFVTKLKELEQPVSLLKEYYTNLTTFTLDGDKLGIYDCFKQLVKKEILEEDNKWYCPKCKEHQRATKKLDFYKVPNILIVHLKRFNNNSKIETVVDFPIEELDITPYIVDKNRDNNERATYELFAIANHFGSMGFGHYIAYAKNYFDNRWHEFNDSSVSEISESSLVSSSAYVLFYKRKNLNVVNWNDIYQKAFVNYEKETKDDKKEESKEETNNTSKEQNKERESTNQKENKENSKKDDDNMDID